MQELKTFYIRDEKRNPMACVVFNVIPGAVEFSTSIVHRDDQPEKKFGRAIALERFVQGKLIILGFCDKVCSPKHQIMRFFADVTHREVNNGPIYPKRIVKAAQHWLSTPKRILETV